LLALRERCLILEGLITFSRVIGEEEEAAADAADDGVEDMGIVIVATFDLEKASVLSMVVDNADGRTP